jgi:hypothetical protein
MVRFRAGVALGVVVVVLAAGCGSSDDSGSSGSSSTSSAAASPTASASSGGPEQTQAWADDLCGAVTTWKTELSTATAQLADRSNLTVEGAKAALSSMSASTASFVDQLRALGPPGTEAGEQVQTSLTTLADTLQDQQKAIGDTLAGVTSPSQLVAALPTLSVSLTAMGTALSSAVGQLRSVDASEELHQAFRASSQCQTAGIG